MIDNKVNLLYFNSFFNILNLNSDKSSLEGVFNYLAKIRLIYPKIASNVSSTKYNLLVRYG